MRGRLSSFGRRFSATAQISLMRLGRGSGIVRPSATRESDMKVTNEDLDQLWKALRMLGWGAAALIMTAPLVAMQFTSEVNWTLSDFVFAGVLLIGGGAVIELVAWRVRNPVIRIGFSLFVIAVVALIWIEGAVGIFH
jgi:hypothetical protein